MAPAVAQEISQGELDATWKQLAAVPRAQLEQAMARLQELGAAAFKQKDYKKAYEHYNQVVTGAEYLQQTGPEPDDTKAVMHALSNRSACKLGLGDAAGAFKDASACVRYDPKWQKGWYRFGRALYEQKRFAEAEAAFAEGVQIDVENGEMLRWRAKCRKQMEAQRVESMRRRRHVTDYSKFAAAEAEADVPDEEAQNSHRRTDAPVVDTVEEMHDLMNKKQQAQLDQQAPTDIYFRHDMIFLPQAESPPELHEEGAFAAMAAYLEQSTSLGTPLRAVAQLHQPIVGVYCRCLRHVAAQMTKLGVGGRWLQLGAGCGVPLLASAQLDATVAEKIYALPAHGSPFLDTTAANLLERHGLRDRVEILRKPVEQVLVDAAAVVGPGQGAEHLPGPALVLVVDPDLFDEGLLGLRVLPYVRHARRALCIPTPLVVPAVARVFCAPVAVVTPLACGFDLSEMDGYRWGPWYEEIDAAGSIQRARGGVTLLAPPQEIFVFDFGADDVDAALPVRARVALDFVANETATLNGVVFWWSLDMVPDETFSESASNAPDFDRRAPPKPAGALQQAIQWVDPVGVAERGAIKIHASHNSTRIRFEVTAPERVTPRVHRNAISRWHFEMVADELRNRAFCDGIELAVAELKKAKDMAPAPRNGRAKTTCEVVDFGTGSGLLALMAARAGATKVVGFDNQGHVVNVARRLVKAHGYEKIIRVIRKDCRQLVMGKDLAQKADLLVMELFDYGFLGEGCLHFVHFAWNNCLREDGAILPRGGRILAMLVELGPGEVEGFDVTPWVTYPAGVRSLGERRRPFAR